MRLRNSRSGRIGSAARRSTWIKPASAARLVAIIAMISGERHGNVLPPRLVNRISPVSATASSAAPLMSSTARRRDCWARKAQPMTRIASRPSGRLM